MTDAPNPLLPSPDDLLAGLTPPPADAAFQEALARRTTGVVRRRRWLRRGGWTMALAACYAAGLLTMHWLPVAAPERDRAPQPAAEVASSEPAPTAVTPPPPTTEDQATSAVALEWQALDNPASAPALYRTAGDRYLEEGNVPAAIRCYRNFLDAEGDAAPAPAASSSWLLMALTEAKQKEKRHAKSNG
jgi:hypothetical protein